MAASTALVIGGGVLGYTNALAMQQRGWQVTLVDENTRMAASWGNAGHIATEQVAPLASFAMVRGVVRRWHRFGGPLDIRDPLTQLPWMLRYLRACTPARFAAGKTALRGLLSEALPAWRRLVERLEHPELLQTCGHWVCWESSRSAHRRFSDWQFEDTGTATVYELEAEKRKLLQSRLSKRIVGAAAFSGTAQIADLPRLSEALKACFIRAGGQVKHAKVTALHLRGRRVQVIAGLDERLDADMVVVCAGVRSRALMEDVNVETPLIAERGYHLQWEAHGWPMLPPVVFEDRSVILTRFNSGLRLAGFVEYASQNASPDHRKWARLRQHAAELGLPVSGEPQPWLGARPTLPDYLPAMGLCSGIDNLAYAFGHQHLGLTLAAVSGELMVDLCSGTSSPLLQPLSLERFSQ